MPDRRKALCDQQHSRHSFGRQIRVVQVDETLQLVPASPRELSIAEY